MSSSSFILPAKFLSVYSHTQATDMDTWAHTLTHKNLLLLRLTSHFLAHVSPLFQLSKQLVPQAQALSVPGKRVILKQRLLKPLSSDFVIPQVITIHSCSSVMSALVFPSSFMAFMCMGILLVIKGNILSTLDEFSCKGLVLQYMLFKGQESSFL